MRSRWEVRLAMGLLLACVASCTSDPIGPVVPVKGKVSVNGTALTTGSVTFWPDDSMGNKSTFEARGSIGADGSFELFTREKKGCPPGAYKVTIVASGEVPDSTKVEKDKMPQQMVPVVYNARETTTLTKEVTDNAAPGAYDLDVK